MRDIEDFHTSVFQLSDSQITARCSKVSTQNLLPLNTPNNHHILVFSEWPLQCLMPFLPLDSSSKLLSKTLNATFKHAKGDSVPCSAAMVAWTESSLSLLSPSRSSRISRSMSSQPESCLPRRLRSSLAPLTAPMYFYDSEWEFENWDDTGGYSKKPHFQSSGWRVVRTSVDDASRWPCMHMHLNSLSHYSIQYFRETTSGRARKPENWFHWPVCRNSQSSACISG